MECTLSLQQKIGKISKSGEKLRREEGTNFGKGNEEAEVVAGK